MDARNIVLFILSGIAAIITVTIGLKDLYPFPHEGWFILVAAVTCLFRIVLLYGELLLPGIAMMPAVWIVRHKKKAFAPAANE